MAKNKHQQYGGHAHHWFLGAALIVLFGACGPHYLYQENKQIPDGQWRYADTVTFQFAITDTSELYTLYLDFEHADTFAAQNLYVNLHTVFPDGQRMSKQKSFDLFDEQGQPAGKCSGHTCRLRVVLQEQTYFNQPGTYTIALEQYTRINPLPGIRSVGLAVMGPQR